ncbi:phenazine biosynthesis protein PhzF family [Arsukibacterium tuosuense]|uniref:Phenazine biosynthesis protein PhzF family n=1 Tax=Arsukibacterium tuosuense TaxID=1323745 RepID=A0A285IDA7_9GAMM|nr:PhzF family phenazine biosynthesis protein [Arsukibacterium tuosuense]SNY45913.1 phenazine biosynthesis protein PhzF family [Arsukibacterium tuosuense]
MELDIFIVDAFTREQFKGNSAAVVPLQQWLAPGIMQNIAAENNLSETAFIRALSTNKYEIRWFSPLTEIDFCGHATLAASYVIFNQLGGQGEVEFVTREVGSLFVNQHSDGRIEMSFPNQCPQVIEQVPGALLAGLSVAPIKVLKNRQAYFAIMASEQDVKNLSYRSEQLKQLAPFDVVVSAKASSTTNTYEYDFISRYFWPANGGDEDPVTGSIHAGLAPYWAKQLAKDELVAYQASARGGILFCSISNDRVLVSGFAVLYLKGTAYI